MAYGRETITRTCEHCCGRGTMTREEDEQTGAMFRWIAATGCFEIDEHGTPVCHCGKHYF